MEKFVETLVNDVGTAMRGALCYIGDKLRIFKAMATTGPVTVDELARHTGLNARYLREWLGAMVTSNYIEYSPETGRYLLPPEHCCPQKSFPTPPDEPRNRVTCRRADIVEVLHPSLTPPPSQANTRGEVRQEVACSG